MAEEINFLYQTGVAAFTSSCPGTNASLTTLDLRILEDGVAVLTYQIITDEGDGSGEPVRPYSVVSIDRPPTEITAIRPEIALPPE